MIWLAVTADKYELPVATAGSARELARIMRTTETNIHNKRKRKISGKRCGYRVVTVKD